MFLHLLLKKFVALPVASAAIKTESYKILSSKTETNTSLSHSFTEKLQVVHIENISLTKPNSCPPLYT